MRGAGGPHLCWQPGEVAVVFPSDLLLVAVVNGERLVKVSGRQNADLVLPLQALGLKSAEIGEIFLDDFRVALGLRVVWHPQLIAPACSRWHPYARDVA